MILIGFCVGVVILGGASLDHEGPDAIVVTGIILLIVALIVIYVATQLGAGLVMAATADRTQRLIMFGLPLVFVPIIISFPAGLIVYWITTNVWTIGQQLAVKKLYPKPERPEDTPADAQRRKIPTRMRM